MLPLLQLAASDLNGGMVAFVGILGVLLLISLVLVVRHLLKTRGQPDEDAAPRGPRAPGLGRDEDLPEVEEDEEAAAPKAPSVPGKPAPVKASVPGSVPAPAAPKDEGASIKEGLLRTRKEGFVARLAGLFRKDLSANLEHEVEEILLTADIGVHSATALLETLRQNLNREKLTDRGAVFAQLKTEVANLLLPVCEVPPPPSPTTGPEVWLVVGVNGAGKTTSIGKLGARLTAQGKKVLFVAADTFRAAAIGQLGIWAQRAGADFFPGTEGADPASVVFDGVKQGVEGGYDHILVDTAGRLHTKANLLEELKKVRRVAGKACEGAPHQTLLVLDATNGQNALAQAEIFSKETGVDGLVLTKLDGTAKGGVVLGVCQTHRIPVRWVGVGEKVPDLRPFQAREFVEALFAEADGTDESA